MNNSTWVFYLFSNNNVQKNQQMKKNSALFSILLHIAMRNRTEPCSKPGDCGKSGDCSTFSFKIGV